MAVSFSIQSDPAGIATGGGNIATYSGLTIGSTTNHRLTAVCCHSSIVPVSATIEIGTSGQLTMNQTDTAVNTNGSTDVYVVIFYLATESYTGTTANIRITFASPDSSGSNNKIYVHKVSNASATAVNFGTDTS